MLTLTITGGGSANLRLLFILVKVPGSFLKKNFFSFTHEQNQLIVSKRHSWTLTPVFSFRDIYELLMFYSLAEGLTIICSQT